MEAMEDFGEPLVVNCGLGTLAMPQNPDSSDAEHDQHEPMLEQVGVDLPIDEEEKQNATPADNQFRQIATSSREGAERSQSSRAASSRQPSAPAQRNATETGPTTRSAETSESTLPAKQLFKFLTPQQENREKVFLAQLGQLVQDVSEAGRLSADTISGLSTSLDRLGAAMERMSFILECQFVHDYIDPRRGRDIYLSVPLSRAKSTKRSGKDRAQAAAASVGKQRQNRDVPTHDPFDEEDNGDDAAPAGDECTNIAEDEQRPSNEFDEEQDEDESNETFQQVRASKRARQQHDFRALHTGKSPVQKRLIVATKSQAKAPKRKL